MSNKIAKKTFSIKSEIATQLEQYNNKSKFVNDALTFYIEYLESFKKHKDSFLEEKIKEALEGDFYSVKVSNKANINEVNYISHSDKLENELLLAINES